MAAYYNEIDPFAAAWLRELIKAGLIADGEVDERSIELVRPDDLRGFAQCHFFAGIGGWSYALRLAEWPDDRSVWTGSCPCQPFSAAGRRHGANDSRHLWPTWFELIRQCRPVCLFGEQVESAIGHGWIDRVFDDLEREDYAVGPVGLPSASVGAFDIRQRLWFVADTQSEGDERLSAEGRPSIPHSAWYGETSDLADAGCTRRQQITGRSSGDEEAHGAQYDHLASGDGSTGRVGDAASVRQPGRKFGDRGDAEGQWPDPAERGGIFLQAPQRRPIGGLWADAEWIDCADGKARPVEPGTFPLAYGIPARMGRLRGYGNAINPEVAAAFIEAYCEARGLTA